MLRIAVPNKGSLSDPGRRDAARGRVPATLRRPRPDLCRRGQRRRVLLPASARHRHLCRLRRSRPRHHRPGPADRLRRGAEEMLDLGFGRATFRFAGRARDGSRPRRPGRAADRHRVPGRGRRYLPSTASRPRWSRWTARSRTRSGWAWPTSSPMWCRPVRRCARPVWNRRRAAAGVVGGADPRAGAWRATPAGRPSCCAGCRASWSPAGT